MTQLTRREKLDAYTYALLCIYEYLSNDNGDCFVCNNLGRWINENEKKCYPFSLEDFPEFAKQQPVNSSGSWWGIYEMDKRIAAIERAIHLTEQL